MPTEVVMPQMGESITEGTLTKWLKKPGDTVARDEPLFEISTDKVDAEIPSPVAGTLGEIKVQEGATVSINTVVCTVEEGGAAAAPNTASAPKKEDTVTPAAVATAAKDVAAAAEATAHAAAAPAAAGPGTEVLMPQMGESITEGTITKWLKKIGDTVQRDEPIFEISTDKVDAEIPSPVAGILTAIKVEEGATVTINTVVAVIGGGAAPAAKAPAAAAPTPAAASAPAATPAPVAASASAGEGLRSSPLVRKIASENNVNLSQVPGTGASGRITKQDILGHLEGGAPAAQPVAAAPVAAPTPASKPAAPAAPQPQPGELVPMTKMRAIIAKRMVESKATSAHVHTVFKVDMTRIVKLREKEKNKYEQRNGVKLTYMPFITRAAVQALRKHPIVNSTTQGEAILYNKNINIGIAVALEWGLIVPVIKQSEEKSFLGIARSIVDLADRARSKKLAPDDVAGGTFTLTNSGIFGEQFGTPIIAQPQSAILGIGGLNKEAVVLTDKDGQDTIAIRSIQRFTLGFDHRTIDGSDAGKFMTDFKSYLENWTEEIG
ncbi:2-oxoglutarate dehydrogenase, E2 component, dihydrolipoamide succinyltransferase [Granulicella mallensis]|uniref:Dihydrolipoamide acetyltransferase component of pyruvate dehydrogenase complex n=1 Tax=Granulicella mallensis (strain ATCC BAA-1857 / DSM 23137 / MP5ACTX8) TaxID=682795 RepID=G8NZK2_GRAMM|nr:2-oxoglutarate dehydrogenase, E2 component, dihydrolipoamide succinyltransferase [Granulicella mallensis]AEU39122.1 2-oxoglutarate dehydrogenase, E2 component, dihydrolipoamide succinyltransferase [Granulicella mallensis MP5ACTX8]